MRFQFLDQVNVGGGGYHFFDLASNGISRSVPWVEWKFGNFDLEEARVRRVRLLNEMILNSHRLLNVSLSTFMKRFSVHVDKALIHERLLNVFRPRLLTVFPSTFTKRFLVHVDNTLIRPRLLNVSASTFTKRFSSTFINRFSVHVH